MRVVEGGTKNGLSGSSWTIAVLVLVSAEGGGTEGLEGKIDANGVQEGSAAGRGRGGENGFTFAAAGSGSRSRSSCTMDLVRVIPIEVGSASFVLVLVRRGGVKGTTVAASFIAAPSSFLSAFHFLYLSAGRDQS